MPDYDIVTEAKKALEDIKSQLAVNNDDIEDVKLKLERIDTKIDGVGRELDSLKKIILKRLATSTPKVLSYAVVDVDNKDAFKAAEKISKEKKEGAVISLTRNQFAELNKPADQTAIRFVKEEV